jgi:Secretion system C-terminal sorting domain
MQKIIISIILLSSFYFAPAQTPLTAVTTMDVASTATLNYTIGTDTYNWSTSPNNIQKRIISFNSAGGSFAYSNALNGFVKMRRLNNATTTGDFTLAWSEGSITATPFNMQANMPLNMEAYFDDNVFNKGTDNLFDNASANSNNIERMDWILPGGFTTTTPSKIGFAVFERGADNAHDPFAIAAITALDAMGNPSSYGTLKKVTSTEWGNITSSSLSYRILKGTSGTNLATAGVNTQTRGGIFFSFTSLGIAASTTIYGYSLFANDVPATSTSAQLVDVSTTNSVTYPTNTTTEGGIDLISTTGIFIDNTTTPVKLESFSVNTTNINELFWKISDNNYELKNFEIQKSFDGINFNTIGIVHPTFNATQYNFRENVHAENCFYRIKIIENNGNYFYSAIVKVGKSKIIKSSISPNPVTENPTLNFYAKQAGETVVVVYNLLGKKMALETIASLKGLNATKLICTENLSAGYYILYIVKQDGSTEKVPFIKQ